jgi:hypothetical protein
VRAGVAEDPAAAVDVQDHRQRSAGSNRLEKPYLHVADRGGHGDPFVFPDLDLVDRSGLRGARPWSGGSP